MTKVLILGGSGFIGTNLLKFYLQTDYEVYTTIHKTDLQLSDEECCKLGDRVYNVDLTNKQDVYGIIEGMDVVIHAAIVSHGSTGSVLTPEVHVTDNAIMNSLVLRACHDLEVKHCIFFSCTVMYQSKEVPQSEDDWKIEEEIPYPYFGVGSTKVYTEQMCKFYASLGKCKYTAIRHSNVYGPYDQFDLNRCHVLPALIKKVSEATNTLEIWGDGKAKRDLLYIDDLIYMVTLCIAKQQTPYELFNCGSGEAYGMVEMAIRIMSTMGKSLGIEFNKDKPNIPTVVMLDCKKAMDELGWKNKTTLEKGLKKTIRWYNDFKQGLIR